MPKYHLKLFLAGITPKKQYAIDHFKEILNEKIGSNYKLDITDVLIHPETGLAEDILITPTLICVKPKPTKKLILDLANTKALLATLDLMVNESNA